jgi:glutamine synthetase
MKDVFDKSEAERLSARNMKLIKEIAERTERIEQLVDDLTEARRVANRIYNIHERAMSYHDTVCPKIFEHYLDAASVKMFESTKVMNRKELEARNEVKWETYVKTVQIEARVMGDMSMNHIIPVSTHYQSQLIKNVQGMKDVFSKDEAAKLSARNMKLIREIAERTQRIEQLVEELTEARRIANRIYNIHERAMSYHDTVCPKMDAIRYEIDHLEMIVEDGLWSLPKYRELLFIR